MVVAAAAAIQISTWLLAGASSRPAFIVQVAAGWLATVALAMLATRRIVTLRRTLWEQEQAHRTTIEEVAQLQTQNAMLDIVARSIDIARTFQALALRIARLVPCERVGLSLLRETTQEFETYTARVLEDERRSRPRSDLVFKTERTAIGAVVRSTQPLVIGDMQTAAVDFLDANVMATAGFNSGIVMPLVFDGRGVGTLNVVNRKTHAFTEAHVEILRPIAEILAVAHVAEQAHVSAERYRTIEVMSDVMLSVAAEINSALQTIVGQCSVLERTYQDPRLLRDLATVVREARRIADLLDETRRSVRERLEQGIGVIGEEIAETGRRRNDAS